MKIFLKNTRNQLSIGLNCQAVHSQKQNCQAVVDSQYSGKASQLDELRHRRQITDKRDFRILGPSQTDAKNAARSTAEGKRESDGHNRRVTSIKSNQSTLIHLHPRENCTVDIVTKH